MRTSITFRLLLLTNLLVLGTVGAVAFLASRVSATVVEQRLVRDTALQTARFLESSGLPPSDRMMLNLRQIFGRGLPVGRNEATQIGHMRKKRLLDRINPPKKHPTVPQMFP